MNLKDLVRAYVAQRTVLLVDNRHFEAGKEFAAIRRQPSSEAITNAVDALDYALGLLAQKDAEIARLKTKPDTYVYGHGLIGTSNYGWEDGSCAIGLKRFDVPTEIGSVIQNPSPPIEYNDLVIRFDNQAGYDVFAEYFKSCGDYMAVNTAGNPAPTGCSHVWGTGNRHTMNEPVDAVCTKCGIGQQENAMKYLAMMQGDDQ